MKRNRIGMYAFCLAVSLTTSGCIIHIGNSGHAKRTVVWDQSAEQTTELNAALPDGGTIEVSGVRGSVSVEGAEGDQCRVVADIRVNAATQEVADRLAKAVKVKLHCQPNRLCVITHPPHVTGAASVQVHLRIEAPRRANLDLSTTNHPVDVSGIHGTIRIKTSNGRITATDVAGPFTGRSSNGTVNVTYADSAPAAACVVTSSNGAVTCEAVPGDVRIKTSNGRVRVVHALGAQAPEVCVETSNGTIDYTLPEALPGRVEISSRRGAVNLSRPLPVRLSGRITEDLRGDILDGAPNVCMRLKTSNGSITVR